MSTLLKVKLTLLEEMLGTASPDPEVYRSYIASKAPDAPTVEPEPKVLTAEEIIADIGHASHCYVEVKGDSKIYGAYRDKPDAEHTSIACDVPDLPDLLVSGKARLWNEYPTDEQREAVKWDG